MTIHTRAIRALCAALAIGGALTLASCAAALAPGAAATRSSTAGTAARVVTIGDSITSGSGLAPDQAWPIVLADARDWSLTNLGTDGAGFIAPGLSDENYDSQIADAARLHPDLVIISGSDNDVGQPGDLPAAITSAMKKLRAALPHATIAATSVIGPAFTAEDLAPIDAAVKQAAAEVHATYLDLGDPFEGRDGMLQPDGEHPTASGQQVLADAVGAALDAAHIHG